MSVEFVFLSACSDLLVNAPGKFKERLNIIKKTKAEVMTNSLRVWKSIFPNATLLNRMVFFNRRILPGHIYTSKTTPIICISLAIRMGATEIILWGCDMLTHHAFRRGTKSGDFEIATYERFFLEAKRMGIKIFLGAKGTAFDNYLEVYK